jgi:AraC-like DNA-binding protein
MLRYLAHGLRNFAVSPVPLFSRMNWEFYAVTKGRAAPFFKEGDVPELGRRTLWLLPPQKRHGWKGDGKSCLRAVFHFSQVPQEVQQALGKRNFLSVDLSAQECVELAALAQHLEPHFRKPHQFSAMHCEKALLTLSLLAVRDQTPHATLPLHQRDEERLERAIAWYSVHLASNPTVEQLAAAVHMTSANFRLITRKIRNATPHRIMREIQIKRACEVLANTTCTLDQVAPQCGFQSVEDFCRVYRKEMGVTADVWRKFT